MSERGTAGDLEAALWSAPQGEPPLPPVNTRAQVLPIGALEWADAERLFVRLLHTVRPVQYAKLFGVPGQAQGGIDAYARLPLDLEQATSGGRDYLTLQSRRVKTLTAAKVAEAVDDFLAGEWAAKSASFYFATSFDLQTTQLDAALREQADRLAAVGIAYVPWGVQEVSTLLKDQPRLVDDFFGREWVRAFCGPEAADNLADNLSRVDASDLRAQLRGLYAAVFRSHGWTRSTETASTSPFVVLDVAPDVRDPHDVVTQQPPPTAEGPADRPAEDRVKIASQLGARRRSFRSAHDLLRDGSRSAPVPGTVAADVWLTGGRHRLLIGGPGAGKSSLLRFIATDLLSTEPQSVAVQREYGTYLPVWLPFGFLCKHLHASPDNSLLSATRAWLDAHSAPELWPLVERALRNDRLLLLVDGIDEWTDPRAADHALGVLEAFVDAKHAVAILTTRPYALTRLGWQLPWARAEITALTEEQRRAIVTTILASTGAPAVHGSGAAVDTFLGHLTPARELAELSRTPLFLTLLVTTWQGEPLPQRRFEIYARLIELLLVKHPQMRQRAFQADPLPLTTVEMTTLMAAVAYQLRLQAPGGVAPHQEMRRLIVDAMCDEVLGYERPEARRTANAVLARTEDEFGLIVSHGAGTFGLLHRVVLDHLAGQHLATFPANDQAAAIARHVHDPAWRDVLLSLVASQVNPHVTEQLLAAAFDPAAGPWADLDGYELLAASLGAGAKLTPRSQANHLDTLIRRIETHPSLPHRAALITSLVSAVSTGPLAERMLPVMKKWLTAHQPDAVPVVWAMRDAEVPDSTALDQLLWGLQHPSDDVKLNAAHAIAQRFASQSHVCEALNDLRAEGPTSGTQASAVLALGLGWPDAPATIAAIDWARRQPSLPLRLVALDLVQRRLPEPDVTAFTSAECVWLRSLLREEGFARDPWPAAHLVALAVAGDQESADLALETLTNNGQTGGDRQLAWFLACGVFADDIRFKDWTAEQLTIEHGLILYNVSRIPQSWRTDPAFDQALRGLLTADKSVPFTSGADVIAKLLPGDGRQELLNSLSGWRPYAAARTLAADYGDDPEVRAELTSRLRSDYAQAAPMAVVALDVLGDAEGFQLLVTLLRHPGDGQELRVIVACAAAGAWVRLTQSAADAGPDGQAARDIIASYDPAELAGLCAATGSNLLSWHVPDTIVAWPDQPVVQALVEDSLVRPESTRSGSKDPLLAVVLRIYGGRSDVTSRRIVDTVLGMFHHLEPTLREVLAFELARSSLNLTDVTDLLGSWLGEPDTQVRRISFLGLLQATTRHQQAHENATGAHEPTDHMVRLRETIRDNLCAYGPDLDELRQLAWIGMLLLGDLTLADDLVETIGYAGRIPRVALHGPTSDDVDTLLVSLIAENWEHLRAHFGEQLYERLDATSKGKVHTPDEYRRRVLPALAAAASASPAIDDLIRAEQSPALRHSPHFLLWAKNEDGGTEAVLSAFTRNIGGIFDSGSRQILASILDHDSWDLTDEQFRAVLTRGQPLQRMPEDVLAVYVQLFPHDPVSVAALDDLEAKFRAGSPLDYADWRTVMAIVFGAAAPDHLPAIIARVHTRFRTSTPGYFPPEFTAPLLRRLRTDPAAVATLQAAVADPMIICQDSPLFASFTDPIADAEPNQQPHQLAYLFTTALRYAGVHTPHQDGQVAIARAETPDTVVYNPFTEHEGPLRLAVLDLAFYA